MIIYALIKGPTFVICCELTLTHDITQESANSRGQAFSWVHICAMEYQQLVKTCTYSNLSQINALHRTHVLFSLQ